MATVATEELRGLASDWEKVYKSARFSGIVGDRAHAARGGYHISRQDQPDTNYSVTRANDRAGRSDAAAAIDMSMDTADMRTCTARLIAVFADALDPRRQYINAFNGWSGTGAARRYDVVAHRVKDATPDHKSHCHLEVPRRYVESRIAMRAILSALRGEPKVKYLASIGVGTARPALVAVPGYPGHPLKLGMTDPAVMVLSARMIARGWTSLGAPSPTFTLGLDKVVRAFQKQCGLVSDGIVGPATWPLPWSRPVKK